MKHQHQIFASSAYGKKQAFLKPVSTLLIGLSLVLTSQAFAQTFPDPSQESTADKHRPHEQRQNRLAEELGLDEGQQEAAKEIFRIQREKMRTIRKELSEEKRAQATASRAETRERLANILSEEQLAKFDDLAAKRRDRDHHKPRPHHRRDCQSPQ